MTRLKHVYPTDEIPHLWAHGLDRDIRNQLKNLYTEGDTIYSYGSHFPIARRVVLKDGSIVFLVTTRSYSVTTDRHIHAVRGAMQGVGTVIDIDPTTQPRGLYGHSVGTSLWRILADRQGSSKPVVAWYQRRIDALCGEAATPRISYTTRENRIAEANRWLAKWVETHRVFKLRISVDAVEPPPTIEECRVKYAKQYAAQAERERLDTEKQRIRDEERAIEAAKRAEAAKTLISAYRKSGVITKPLNHPAGGSIYLRWLGYPVLRIDGEQVISSMGARVDIRLAKIALHQAPNRIGLGYDREATVGVYRGFGATDSHMRIGCHTIPWHEIRSFCEYYGWDIPDGIPA